MRHPRRIEAREDGIARSDIRVSEAKRRRVPCRNEGEYRLPLCHLMGRVGGACTFLKRHQGARSEARAGAPAGAKEGCGRLPTHIPSELAPEELDRARRNRCTVRNSDNDGGSNTHVHVTRRIARHTSPCTVARAEAACLHGDGEAGAAADSLHEQGEALPTEGLCASEKGLACAESAGASCLAEGVPFGEEDSDEA